MEKLLNSSSFSKIKNITIKYRFKARCFLFVLFLITQNFLFSQPNLIDSISTRKIDSLINLSGDNWNPKGPYDQNLMWLQQAERISIQTKNWRKQVQCLLIQATVYRTKKDAFHFNNVVEKSYEVAHQYLDEDDSFLKFIYNYMSDIQRKKRAYRKSIEFSEKGIKLCSGCPAYRKGKYYIKIANNYNSLGDYTKAKQYLENALSLDYEEKDNDYFQLYHTHNIYAILSKRTQKFDQAINHFQLAEKYLMTSYKDHYLNELVNIWFGFIEVYLELGNLTEANIYLKKVKESGFLEDELAGGKYKLFLAKSNYLAENEVTENFLLLLDEGIELLGKKKTVSLSFDLMISENLEYKGDTYFNHEMYTEALEAYDKAILKLGYKNSIHNASEVENKAVLIRLLSKKLKIYIKDSNKEQIQILEDALLNLMRYLRIESSSASSIDYWANENLKIIEQIIEYNFQQSNYSKVYAAIEENKSNNLIQDLLESESLGYANIGKEKIEIGRKLKSDLVYCEKKIFELNQSDSTNTAVLNTWTQEESRLQIELDSYLRNLERDFPEYYKLKYDLKQVGVKDIQATLDKQSLLIEYFVGNSKGYAAFVTRDEVDIIEIENITLLNEHALNYYQSLSNSGTDLTAVSSQLYSQLGLEKIRILNPNIKDIIFIADDFLNNIPFETLSNSKGEFLFENYNVHYQYSARLWDMIKSRSTNKKNHDLVCYAYENESNIYADNRSCFDLKNATNLNCANKEVEAVKQILESKKILGLDQNIDNLLSAAADTKILHLATHACLDEMDPKYSRILFNDTLLTNQDLKRMDISAELVVLSACETGFGKVVKGEGSISLAKGLFHAGANSTLVSLWPVDDCTTSDLMGHFYKYLNQGMKKNEALRLTKIDYLKTAHPSRLHPYYWAGFVLIGDEDAVWGISLFSSSHWIKVLMVCFLILMAILIWRYRKNN